MKKRNVSKKTISIVVISNSVMAICLLVVTFFSVWNMLFNTVGERQQQNAEIFSDFIANQFEEEVEGIKSKLFSPWWIDIINEANLHYKNWKSKAILEYMEQMDKEWISLGVERFYVREPLNSGLSQRLKILVEEDSNIGEMFVTDKYGGLVAASGKTSDFYQADEDWWQRAYNNGKGDVYCGEIELDTSSDTIGMAVAIPIRNKTGQVIGISKSILDISTFFETLSKYEIGKTGHVGVFTGDGRVLCHEEMKLLSKAWISEIDLNGLLSKKKNYELVETDFLKEKSFFAVTSVKSDLLKKNNIDWIVAVSQKQNEVFAPLNRIFGRVIILIICVSVFITGAMLKIIQKIFIVPLETIKNGAQHFSNGDFDYPVGLKTGDEFEQLAEILNEMSKNFKNTMVSRDNLLFEINQRTRVEQALDVQLKETEKSRELMKSMLDDNNQIREDLEKSLDSLKNAQGQLIHAEKMEVIGRMASGVAHEVKNPLAIILQAVNYFEGVFTPDQKMDNEMLAMMKVSVKRADRIIRQLLEFSRVENIEMELENINLVIENSLILVQHKLKLKDIKVVNETEEDLPEIMMDKGKIDQVFINLFSNAVDVMPEDGTLYVRSYLSTLDESRDRVGNRENGVFRVGEKAIVVEIEDTGSGMDAETKKKIFDPFFTTKNRAEGTGLGLTITKSIIEMHRGLIDVESEKGKGTKFIIRFKMP